MTLLFLHNYKDLILNVQQALPSDLTFSFALIYLQPIIKTTIVKAST